MLAVLTAIFGFAAPFLPELLKLFRFKMEARQEQDMYRLQVEAQERLGKLRLDEVNVQADMTEMITLHQPAQSFGVQVLDAAKASGFGAWAIVPAFYLFALLDFLAGMVRPAVTYAMVAFYIAVKWAHFQLAVTYSATREQAILDVWTAEDWAVLTLVIGFWFGHRAAKATFGGDAMNGKRA